MADDSATQDRAITRDEGLAKNPIRNRMVVDRVSVGSGYASVDDVLDVVSRARDVFHSFVGQTLHRSYKRVPIYLVDGWIVKALGYFTSVGGRPGERGGVATGTADTAGSASAFASIHALYTELDRFSRSAEGLSVLKVIGLVGYLKQECDDLLERKARGRSETASLELLVGVLRSFLSDAQRIREMLSRDDHFKGQVNHEFFEELKARHDALLLAIENFVEGPVPHLAGVSFNASGRGGLLFDDIPELEIKAPAVVLAPHNIAIWAEGMPYHPSLSADLSTWFGCSRRDLAPFAIGMSNVLQHELTHAMLRVPNDAPDEGYRLSQDRQYTQDPGFEEGLANFVASIATARSLIKSHHGTRGPEAIDMDSSRNRKAFATWRDVIEWTYADYFRERTDPFMQTWERNARDLRAFSGMVAMFATRHGEMNWDQAARALESGVIATTGREGRR